MQDNISESAVSCVVLLRGEYDVYSVAEFERELESLTDIHSTVDMRNVRFLDSTCLAALVRKFKTLRAIDASATLTLTNVSPTLRRAFSSTRLDTIFRLQ